MRKRTRSTATYTEDGTNYAFTYAYNTLGSIDTLTYPVSTSGYQFVLKNVYDAYGYLNQVKDNAASTLFWTLNSTNDSNLPTLETFANGNMITRARGSISYYSYNQTNTINYSGTTETTHYSFTPGDLQLSPPMDR